MKLESYGIFCFSVGKMVGCLQNEDVITHLKKRGASDADIKTWGKVLMEIVQCIYNEPN